MLRVSSVLAGSNLLDDLRRTRKPCPLRPPSRRMRLIDVQRHQQTCLALCARRGLRSSTYLVVSYLLDAADNGTWQAIRKIETIALKTGLSRSTVKSAIKQAERNGLLLRRARYSDQSRRQLASGYSFAFLAENDPDRSGLKAPANATRRASRNCDDDAYDWQSAEAWLSHAARAAYAPYGHGHDMMAADDIDKWRSTIGDRAVIKAIEDAKNRELHGELLLAWLDRRSEFIQSKRK